MNLKQQVENKLAENNIDLALELLQSQPNIDVNYHNDLTILQQNYQEILHREQMSFLTYEEAKREKNKLSLSILQLTDRITAGKPPITITNFLEQTPSKNLVLIVLALEIAIGILGELFPEKVKVNIENVFGSSYNIMYFAALALTIVAFLWLSLRKEKPKTRLVATDIFSKEEDGIRKALLDRYRSRLKQKTDYRLPVTLTLTYTKEGSSPDYLHFSEGIVEEQSIEGDLVATLKKHQHLLIIGDPGAGKTTQLLELAKAWLENGENEKIPVIFNLAAWKADAQRFDEWLQAALVSGYGFSKALASEAIFKSKILPLLDGLDEVGRDMQTKAEQAEMRGQCLKAIDNYLSLFDVNYLAICSRREEYAATKADAPVKATVLVNPLSPAEIRATLKKALAQKISTKDETAATTLLNLLPKHPSLETVLCTPFYYNIALEVFDVRTGAHELPAENTALQQYLVEHFVAEKLGQTPNPKGFMEAKTRHSLAWLAFILNAESRVNFELVDFQPRHLEKKWMGNLVYGLVFGLVFGLVLGLVVGLIGVLVFGLVFGFVVGWNLYSDVRPQEIRKIRWSNLTNKSLWLSVWVKALFFGLYLGLMSESVIGSALGLVIGLNIDLAEHAAFSAVKTPYHRLNSRIIAEASRWMIIALCMLLLIQYGADSIQKFYDFLYYLGFGIPISIFLGLTLTAFFKHLILRLCLYWEKKLPLRWVSFFSYATSARILEQDGGQWRFRHQILQDYFAGKLKRVS
ncbi:NACHT domain-containing protein [Haliscomenobacter hydrossis]|uniref:NACHT domain-containing protein n=1 Tax=Haliscomenobacter hydrossis (strain ATCC 27775 / DSM 1100 / LMG 10767 / O) TaxID=760192 RepID=F4KZY6_HALH1|nr:NACHT domain-containing protein [Haliscomenobacter hydrossis]AEE51556.1 hypothetical protein Halhy_3704 [Haliscomenobacter hydrossis DSM 1100]